MIVPSLVNALFPGISFGDARRDRRFAHSLQAFAEHGGGSLPTVFPLRADYEGFLRLIHSESCTHEHILSTHQTHVLDFLERQQSTVLFLHDATVLDFSGHESIRDDLGPVGNGGGRGWMAFQTIAVDPTTQRIHGLVHQRLFVRPESTKGRSVAERREAADRETLNWLECVREIGPAPVGCRWIHITDRGGDTFEFLQALQDGRHRFVIRSSSNRALGNGRSDEKASQLLHDQLRALPAKTTWTISTPNRKQKTTQVCAAAMPVSLRPPHVKSGKYRSKSIQVNAVRVWEPNPPEGEEALEWILLTSEPIETESDLQQVVNWYARRWTSEEYHKVQKSGLGVEVDQVQDVDSLAALVVMRSVLAVWLFNGSRDMRDEAAGSQPAARRIPALWLRVLRVLLRGRGRLDTVRDFWIQIARLGGYLKRNPMRHPPGWQVLWRGWLRFQAALGYELSRAET